MDGHHPRVVLADLERSPPPHPGVDPVGDSGQAGPVVDGDSERPVEDAGGVEDVVDLFILQQAVGVDARAGHVEAGAGKGIVSRERRAEHIAEIGRRSRDRRRVEARTLTGQPDVVDHQRLQGRVAGPFAETEEGTVGGGTPIEPGRHRVEVIVTMPLEMLGLNAKGVGEEPHEARHPAWQRRFRPGQTEAHRVAQPELHRHPRLAAELLQGRHQWRDEAIQVGAGQVFEMTARPQPGIDHRPNDVGVVLGRLPPGAVHLEVDVVVGG